MRKKEQVFICFEYDKQEYSLEMDSFGFSLYLDVQFDNVCGSDNPDCDHDYHRCMVIENIFKKGFDFRTYCNVYLTRKTDEDNDDSEFDLSIIKELVEKSISPIDVTEYIDCCPEADYYGEILRKDVNLTAITTRIVEKLSEDFLKVRIK